MKVNENIPAEFDSKRAGFRTAIRSARLSARTVKTLLSKTFDLKGIMSLSSKNIEKLGALRNRGGATVVEMLKFQKKLRRKFGTQSLQPAFGDSCGKTDSEHGGRGTDPAEADDPARQRIIFECLVNEAGLSVRASNILLQDVRTIRRLFELEKGEILNFQQCGQKTLSEILAFKAGLADRIEKAGHSVGEELRETTLRRIFSYRDFSRYEYLLDDIRCLLSDRSRNVLKNHRISSLESFMAMPPRAMKRMKNCGKVSIAEYKRYQGYVDRLFQKIDEHGESGNGGAHCSAPSPAVVYKLFDDIVSEGGEPVNPDNPFPSLKQWVAEVCPASENDRKAFMLRMGMLGGRPMKLTEIGDRLGGLTRERIRQILERAERRGRYRHYQARLDPIVHKIAETVEEHGGKVANETLPSLVLVRGEGGENLKHATMFLDFLSSFSAWRDIGLHIDKKGVVSIDTCSGLVKGLFSEIADISRRHGEVTGGSLWFIDYRTLKGLAADWCGRHYPKKGLSSVSDVLLEEAISSDSRIKKEGDRVYSRDLWIFKHDRLTKATETVLKTAKRAMHFTEVHAELQPYRPELAASKVHPILERNRNLILWDRGTYIHKFCVTIPKPLISDIENWVLKQLRKDGPLISSYGPFTHFKERCLRAGVPNDNALYSLLREAAHPLLAYPRLPYIYPVGDDGRVEVNPVRVVVENFLREAGRPVAAETLRRFMLGRLRLKTFQFEQIKLELSRTIKVDGGRFLHMDCLELDLKEVRKLVEYIERLLESEEHVSAGRIFAERNIAGRLLGVNGPVGLFSLLRLLAGDSFELRSYPQIRRIAHSGVYQSKGIADEIINHVKAQGRPCSYRELNDLFVGKLGYNARTVYCVRYRDCLLNRSNNSLIHMDMLDWNDAKQGVVEKIAYDCYTGAVRAGKPFGSIESITDSGDLPHIGPDLFWTPYLAADILTRCGRFKVLGTRRNAFVPIPNKFGIETFQDLVYELLKDEYEGRANLADFTKYLRTCGVIVKNLTERMLKGSKKVRVVGEWIMNVHTVPEKEIS